MVFIFWLLEDGSPSQSSAKSWWGLSSWLPHCPLLPGCSYDFPRYVEPYKVLSNLFRRLLILWAQSHTTLRLHFLSPNTNILDLNTWIWEKTHSVHNIHVWAIIPHKCKWNLFKLLTLCWKVSLSWIIPRPSLTGHLPPTSVFWTNTPWRTQYFYLRWSHL